MKTAVCQSIECLRKQVIQWRKEGETVAFVPTMGNLHEGHLSLVDLAKEKADHVVVSIFVNPLQFAPDEDFDSYPRTLSEDLALLESRNVALVFTPDSNLMYPQGESETTTVTVPALSSILEGAFRPGFFQGVATVVIKLFNMVQPDYAVFGEKDYQQLLVIRRMVSDLNLPIEIVAGKIVREQDGLAMSSRNRYLNASERASSQVLSAALEDFKNRLVTSSATTISITEEVKSSLVKAGFSVDYVTLREPHTLAEVPKEGVLDGAELIILAAATIGRTRLIDNLKFTYKSQ